MSKQGLLRRWNELWDTCGVRKGGRSGHFDRLYVQYAAKSRGYHGILHIEYGLGVFDRFKHLAVMPQAVEAAWWFHDVIYVAGDPLNEKHSGEYMLCATRDMGLLSLFRDRVYFTIMATMHDGNEVERDKQLICDIDLSTFGAKSWDEVCRNSRGIRKEALSTPIETFIANRRRVLGKFLKRDTLFYLPEFRDEFDTQAKRNIEREIEELPKIIANVL